MSQNALIIFVKNLIDGHVKTRLAATLGNEVAMDIYKQLLQNAHHNVQSLAADKIVFYSDFIEDDIWENNVYTKQMQQGNSLEKKMENAFKSTFAAGYQKLVIIGTDCPGINENILQNAFAKLEDHDIVIGPATDGGYYLLGMKKEHPYLFHNIKWSTNTVLEKTIDRCHSNQLSYILLPELSDIDEEKDLVHFKSLVMLKHKSL
jgi:hypothetical protein